MSISYEINSIDVEIKKDCPVCKTRNIKKISDVSLDKGNYNFPFFETSFCEACQHIYRSKRPDEKWFFKNLKKEEFIKLKITLILLIKKLKIIDIRGMEN